jgi:hypothetical protein
MKRIANFPAMVGSIINGDFLLISIVPRMAQFGAPFKEPMLEDATGLLTHNIEVMAIAAHTA